MGNDQSHRRSVGVETVGVGRDSKIPLFTGGSSKMRSRDRATLRVAIAYYDVICYVLSFCPDSEPQNQSAYWNETSEYSQLVGQISHAIKARVWWDVAYVSKRWRPWKTRPRKKLNCGCRD